MNASCPVCGSYSLDKESKSRSIPVIYGSPAIYEEIFDVCLSCGEKGDFSYSNDKIIEESLKYARKQSVVNMMASLVESGVKMAYIERSLELPKRTIARWKAGEVSAATLALLRIIRTFPWILDVADSGFNEKESKRKIFEECVKIIGTTFDEKNVTPSVFIYNDRGSMKIDTTLTYKTTELPPESKKPRFKITPISIGGNV